MFSVRSQSRGDAGDVVHAGSRRAAGRSPDGLSRRQFLRYAAVGAGALAIGGPAVAESLAPADDKILCSNKVFFLPRLEIHHGSVKYASPDIWLTDKPDVNAPPVAIGAPSYAVARIHNVGSAPIFNASVVFYVVVLSFFVDTPLPGFGPRFGGLGVLGTQYVSIPPLSDRLVLAPSSFNFVPGDTLLVVECFDPLVDPPVVTTGSEIPVDRRVAAQAI